VKSYFCFVDYAAFPCSCLQAIAAVGSLAGQVVRVRSGPPKPPHRDPDAGRVIRPSCPRVEVVVTTQNALGP